ncbi:hypothetical protein D3C79_555970 [compost metagenome]
MGVALLAVEEAAQAEGAGERPLHRLVEQQVAGLGRAEGLIGLGLLRQLAVDAHHVLGQRVDLAAVLQLDVLLTIVLGLDQEAEPAAIAYHQGLRAGGALERDADYGYPATALLTHDQHRLVLITGAGRLWSVPQCYHGHATRHRMIEQTADEAWLGIKMSAAQQQDKEQQAAHGGSIE